MSMYSLPSTSQSFEPEERSVTMGYTISFHWERKPATTLGSAKGWRYAWVRRFDSAVRLLYRAMRAVRYFSCRACNLPFRPCCTGLYGPKALNSCLLATESASEGKLAGALVAAGVALRYAFRPLLACVTDGWLGTPCPFSTSSCADMSWLIVLSCSFTIRSDKLLSVAKDEPSLTVSNTPGLAGAIGASSSGLC